MKLSKIQQIIKEEVAKAIKENYATKVGKAIKANAEGKSEKEQIKMISDYLAQDGNSRTAVLNLMNNEDFIPDVLYTINNKTENKNDELNDKFKKAVGFQEPAPGGRENRIINKLYTFEYVFWFGKRSNPDYSFDFVSVIAPTEQKARDLAYDKAQIAHGSLRSSKEKFDLTSVQNLEDVEAFKNISDEDIDKFNNDELVLVDK